MSFERNLEVIGWQGLGRIRVPGGNLGKEKIFDELMKA